MEGNQRFMLLNKLIITTLFSVCLVFGQDSWTKKTYVTSIFNNIPDSSITEWTLIKNHKVLYTIRKSSTEDYWTLYEGTHTVLSEWDDLQAAKDEANSLTINFQHWDFNVSPLITTDPNYIHKEIPNH